VTIALKPYPAYKDSDIEWLGDVPEHWDARRLKQVCSGPPMYGANVPAQSYTTDGARFIRTSDIREDGSLRISGSVHVPVELVRDSLVERGDFLISRSGTIGRALVVDDHVELPAAYAGYLVRFRTKDVPTSRWVYLFSKTGHFQDFIRTVVTSSTIDNVNGRKYANMPLPIPPLDEQRAIADFVGVMDARITRFIAAKRRMIALLEEKKLAVINQAVTRGLDPDVPLKDSGVDWLGEIPAHWELQRLKQVCAAIVDCKNRTP
jgi:type I restriction enzyme S subunit